MRARGHGGIDHAAHFGQINPAQQVFDRPDRGGAHRQHTQAHGGQAQRLDRPAGILATERQGCSGFGAALHDVVKELQEPAVERVIAPPHQFILAIGRKEELLEVIAADRDEIDLLEKAVRGEGQRGCFQHRAHLDACGHHMAQGRLAVQLSHQMGAGGGEFVRLGNEGKHDRQLAPLRRPDQRLQLHAQHAGFVQPDADRAPAHRRVRLVLRLHVRQDLVRSDVQRAEGHTAALGGIEHARIDRRQLAALGHLAAHQELQLGAEQPHAFGARAFQAGQISHQARVHVQGGHRAAF